jgi:hypothetical protein
MTHKPRFRLQQRGVIALAISTALTLGGCAESPRRTAPPAPVVQVAPREVPTPPQPRQPLPETCQILSPSTPVRLSDGGPGNRQRGYICVKVQGTLAKQGIVTLTRISQGADWNLLIGDDFSPISKTMANAIEYSNNSGSTSELAFLPDSQDSYTIVAYPSTSVPSTACLVFHRLDTVDMAANAALLATAQWLIVKGLTSEDSSQTYQDNANRAVAAGLSAIQGNELAAVGYDLVLNEISLQLSNLFGTGSWLFTFGTNYFGSYLKESTRYIWDSSSGC